MEPVEGASPVPYLLTPAGKLWPHVEKTATCWLWKGPCDASGTGFLMVRGQEMTPERVSYELTYAPVVDGMRVVQTCGNRVCCNPAHLVVRSIALLDRPEPPPREKSLRERIGDGDWRALSEPEALDLVVAEQLSLWWGEAFLLCLAYLLHDHTLYATDVQTEAYRKHRMHWKISIAPLFYLDQASDLLRGRPDVAQHALGVLQRWPV